MSESGGRRIKRAINIDMSSIRFCTQEMLERFSKIQYITEYLEQKRHEISNWNAERNVDASDPLNGRQLTNLGTFRAYVVAYLRNHPMIHQEMTFLVRHLAPTEHGLPIELYVFSRDQVWSNYEGIQADIFDHILAIAPAFDLRVYRAQREATCGTCWAPSMRDGSRTHADPHHRRACEIGSEGGLPLRPPHHRAYGSVHGGSSAPLQIPELSQKVQESPYRKQALVHGRMHVRGPRVPPGARPVAVALRARAASSPFKAVHRFSLRSTSSSNVWVCGPIGSVLAGAV